ncbi:MAG TPA: hypothetical protein VHW23_11520 [Kofleriaceae bacterium]|jgi:hypothetical protein|nr:hypothetical protein [Kofleriaceae bacterium]
MRKPQVRSGSFAASKSPRVVTEDQLKTVTGGDGVTGQRLPQVVMYPELNIGAMQDW